MRSFCRTAWVCSFFFRLLWKWDNFMAAPISADKWNYLLTHLLLILWKKEHLQGTINSRNRKGEGSYTKSKGNVIQHDRYVVRCNSLQMLEVFSIEVGIKCSFSEGKEEHMLQFLTWDVGWCQGLVRHLQWTDMLLTFEEHKNIDTCGNEMSVSWTSARLTLLSLFQLEFSHWKCLSCNSALVVVLVFASAHLQCIFGSLNNQSPTFTFSHTELFWTM